jgi:hypothetical protein
VLAYRLQRALLRAPEDAPCVAGTYRLATPRADASITTPRAGAAITTPLLASERRGVPVVLTQDSAATCPLALGNGNDR